MKSAVSLHSPKSSLGRRYAYRCRTGEQAGIALIITLAVLVLISALILAFLSTALLHRQISFSSSGQNRANILAKTAMDTILGDFTSEIQAGSTTYTSNNIPIYIPTNYSTNAATMVPFRTVLPALTNLVTVSEGGTNFWSTTGSSYSPQTGPARASGDTHYLVTTPSANGRYLPISANSWLKPQLLDAAVTNQFPTPAWIMITRQGPVTSGTALPAIATMANSSPSNMSYAIGRYAYAVYDVGGLVDVNVAGNGFGLNSTQNAQRGRLQQAALSQLPLADSTPNDSANVAAAKNLVAWRSPVGQNDTSWLFNATNNFMTVDPAGSTATTSDQAFLSRQDLIQYFQSGQTGLNANALQYLTVFTRELNQPSYTPAPLTSATFPTMPFPGNPAYTGLKPKLQPTTLTSSSGYAYGVGNGSLTSRRSGARGPGCQIQSQPRHHTRSIGNRQSYFQATLPAQPPRLDYLQRAQRHAIIGGYATVAGNDWATLSGGNIIALSSYTNDTWGTAGTANVTVTATSTQTNQTANTLRFSLLGTTGNSSAYSLGANSYSIKPMSSDKLSEFTKALQEYWLQHDRACGASMG